MRRLESVREDPQARPPCCSQEAELKNAMALLSEENTTLEQKLAKEKEKSTKLKETKRKLQETMASSAGSEAMSELSSELASAKLRAAELEGKRLAVGIAQRACGHATPRLRIAHLNTRDVGGFKDLGHVLRTAVGVWLLSNRRWDRAFNAWKHEPRIFL